MNGRSGRDVAPTGTVSLPPGKHPSPWASAREGARASRQGQRASGVPRGAGRRVPRSTCRPASPFRSPRGLRVSPHLGEAALPSTGAGQLQYPSSARPPHEVPKREIDGPRVSALPSGVHGDAAACLAAVAEGREVQLFRRRSLLLPFHLQTDDGPEDRPSPPGRQGGAVEPPTPRRPPRSHLGSVPWYVRTYGPCRRQEAANYLAVAAHRQRSRVPARELRGHG